jgi:DNA invertase Pin-like site-specific DNA recombinase
MKEKVAIYCRVSTDQQTTLNQKIRLEEYTNSKGWRYELFEEVESSRKTRPVKAQLLQRLRNKEFDAVLVYKLDRWARSSSELILEVNELVNKKIGFISLTEQLDFTSATGKLMFNLLSSFAEFERDLIRSRTMEGLNRVKQQGKKLGRPKGSKDKKTRRKSGYILRAARENQSTDKANGINKELATYL